MRAPHLLGHVAAQLVGLVNGGAVAFVPRQRQLLQRRYDVPPLPRQPAARLQVKTREPCDLSALSCRCLCVANEAAMAEPVQAAPGRPTRSGKHSGSAGWGVSATHVVQRKRGTRGDAPQGVTTSALFELDGDLGAGVDDGGRLRRCDAHRVQRRPPVHSLLPLALATRGKSQLPVKQLRRRRA